jgi:hypothetical protein
VYGVFVRFQGAGKKKSVTPLWVGGSEYEKGMGSDLFVSILFYRVFELPPPRNAQKRDKTN